MKNTKITRLWHGITSSEDAEAYATYLLQTGVRDFGATPGNRGALVLRRQENGQAHFWILSMWDSTDSVRAFAGEDIDRARFYPEDDRYLLEKDETVLHCETVLQTGRLPRLIRAFQEVYDGSPWYGNAIVQVLEGIGHATAVRHPLPGKHSIFEIVAHSLGWRRFALQLLRGETVPPRKVDDPWDWPTPSDPSPADWPQLLTDYHEGHRQLIEQLRHTDEQLLDQVVPGRTFTFEFLLEGVLQHDLYHLGQISWLK